MTKSTSKNSTTSEVNSPETCTFTFADGRHCQMSRWKRTRPFCLFHTRQEQQLQLFRPDYIGRGGTLTYTGQFRTATDVNAALGELFEATARNRVPPRKAAVLAYIGHLLLQSLPHVKSETIRAEGQEAWDEIVKRTFDVQYSDEPEAAPESASESHQDSKQDSAQVDPALEGRSNPAQSGNPG